MCLDGTSYIPLLTERRQSGYRAINMLLLRSKNLATKQETLRANLLKTKTPDLAERVRKTIQRLLIMN